ncbi:hypothetical protein BH10CYA1_BH10CYA1_64990 [soil metagenome]
MVEEITLALTDLVACWQVGNAGDAPVVTNRSANLAQSIQRTQRYLSVQKLNWVCRN